MSHPLFDAIHHVAIIASDYARSRHFYHQVLGLPIIAETLREERQSWKLDLALPDGSQDCVLLTTLPSGAYTLQVVGVGGTDGLVLAEVYAVP